MGRNLQSYDMELTAVGPLFIGSGEKLLKKEYLYHSKKGLVLVPDLLPMCRGLRKKRLEREFFQFIEDQSDRRDLWKWLWDHQVSAADYQPWIRYQLSGGDHLQSGKRPMDIACFVKDSFGIPYIPGSSIKGMLRTILICYELINDPLKCNDVRRMLPSRASTHERMNRNVYLSQEKNRVEKEILYTLNRSDAKGKPVNARNDAVNDNLSGLIVSDSVPLKLTDLVLCQKLDRGLDGSYNSKLNVLRECIKPGTSISFRLTIDPDLCPYSVEDIFEAVKIFGSAYYSLFLSKFAGTDRPREDRVWLGGGTGYFTKTILYPMLGATEGTKTAVEIFRRTISPKNWKEHGHEDDVRKGVSPHTLKYTEYNGKAFHMGECSLRIKEKYT